MTKPFFPNQGWVDIESVKDFDQALDILSREKQPAYFVMSDGQPLSIAAAVAEKDGIREALAENAAGELDPNSQWLVVAWEINWENADLVCCHTGDKIESAYDIKSEEE